MEIFGKEIYTLVIPIKPEKDQPNRYFPGSGVGNSEYHKEHLERKGGVFWSWHLTNAGTKKPIKEKVLELAKDLGVFYNIEGKMIKINDHGFFYSSEDKSIKWKFRAKSLTTGNIKKGDLKFVPEFRKVHLGSDWISWLLIEELEELKKPVKGKRIRNSNAYKFPDLYFYSNPNNKKEIFNTNHLTGGNSFLIEECI